MRLVFFANFKFWIFYTRFFLNIEISWNNNIIWFESLLKLHVRSYVVFMSCIHELYSWNLKNRCDRDFRIEYFTTWKIIVIVIFASNILFFSIFSQSAIKIWKSFSWMTQKKHDLMIRLFVAFRIENLISYNLQSSIWWLTANCVTVKSEFESIFIFLFFYLFVSYIEIDELIEMNV